MKKSILLFVIFSVWTTLLVAQNYQEVLYLKNGSMIRGVVIEQIPDESCKIKTSDGSIFVYSWSEISKIAKEEIKVSNPINRSLLSSESKQDNSQIKSHSQSADAHLKYYGEVYTLFGLAAGYGLTAISFGVHTVQGVIVKDIFVAGIGLGFNEVMLGSYSDFSIPIYLNIKAYAPFRNRSKSSYFAGFDLATSSIGGFSLNSFVGVSIANKFNISMAYDALSRLHDTAYVDFRLGYRF